MITLPYTTLLMYIKWKTAVPFKRDSLYSVSKPCQIIKNQWGRLLP